MTFIDTPHPTSCRRMGYYGVLISAIAQKLTTHTKPEETNCGTHPNRSEKT
ncbi:MULTISPECIES: hypothetical protein [Nostocales]|uniref:Uncharacterized protein n=3 Tax=Nostocales TaxID=1161 RepID=A0A8S9TDP3_9CYAN|nr:hypothetical protein [Tolypothrix bouteillei]KAF3890731.1 hypothetical protein DA73_0400038775 [Tolypothrix bouteillei VB521301]